MPLRRACLPIHLSQWELPVLSFLTPRIFTPWPKGFHTSISQEFVRAATLQAVVERLSCNASRFEDTINVASAPVRVPQRHGNPGVLFGSSAYTFPGQDHHYRMSCREYSVTNDSSSRPIVAQNGGSKEENESFLIRDNTNLAAPGTRTELYEIRDSLLIAPSPSSWSAALATLGWEYDPKLYGRQMLDDVQIIPDRRIRAGDVSVKNLVGTHDFKSILEGWTNLPLAAKEAVWPQIMLQALKKCPASAFRFLVATASRPYPPRYAMSGSLNRIVYYYLYKVEKPHPQDVHTIFHVVLRLLDKIEKGYFHLTQRTIYLLLINLEGDDVWKFYSRLKQISHPLHENTLLHFVKTLACSRRTSLAIEVLQEIHSKGTDFTQSKLESVCATLLQRKHQSSSEPTISDSEVFALMLKFGLRPNIQIYTILVKNAIDNGDSETAWQIHDAMLENNVKPNEYTYSVLLNDAKLRKDWVSVDGIKEKLKSNQIGDEHIITDLLHAVFLRYEQVVKSSPGGSHSPFPFRHMLDLYCEFFDSGPLKELLGSSRYLKYLPDSDPGKIHPSKYPLTVMCIAFMKGHTEKQMTLSWYQNFRKLLARGHPDAIALAESTYLYDAVIMSLGRTSTTTRLCTNVVRDMLTSYEKAQEVVNPLQERSVSKDIEPDKFSLRPNNLEAPSTSPIAEKMLDVEPYGESYGENTVENPGSDTKSQPVLVASRSFLRSHCQPSVRTWSILLKVFMDHGQPRAAEKVIKMMNARGIEPNQVTWNSLAIGYARMQDIPGTVGTIERFEKEGLKVDEWTLTGLHWIRKRTELIRAMERKDEPADMEWKPSKEQKIVEGLTRDISKVIRAAKRHFYPTEFEQTKILRQIPERLGLGIDDFIFPSNKRQPQALKSLGERRDDQIFLARKESADGKGK